MEKYVEYQTPVGTFRTWEDAHDACVARDLDPCDCIKVLVSPTDVSAEFAYGSWTRLSNAVRVF